MLQSAHTEEGILIMKGFKELRFEYDMIIVGGGLTGLCAAIAAARHGTKVALVQDRPVLGGNASSEIRMHICGASTNMKKPELCEGGIVHELQLENKRFNDSHNFSIWDAVLFNAAKKEKNLTLYLNTTMHSAKSEGDRVTEISCYQMSTERQLTLTAPIFADCTGSGTLAAFVGAEFRTGSESKAEHNEPHAPETADNHRMGNTLLFKAVDMGRPVKFTPPVDAYHFTEEQLKFRKHSADEAAQLEKKASASEQFLLFDGFCQDYGYWWIEIPGDEEYDIIEQYEDIRDQLVKAVYGVWDHIKNDGDHGAENYELAWVGMLPGTRESRRIEGVYMLNENDVLERRRFDDAVAYGGWHIDNHVPGGLFAFEKIPSFVFGFDGAYTIPYRSYLSKNFRNLFIAGRSMGATKLAMASSRVMGTCAIGGQAVGTAAALCKKYGCEPMGVMEHMDELQQTLLMDDCFIPDLANHDEKDLALKAAVTASSEQEAYPAKDILTGVTRRYEGVNNQWRSEGMAEDGEWIELKLAAPAKVKTVQVVFDSNFDIEKKISLSSRRQKQQEVGVPKELAKDFRIELMKDGVIVSGKTFTGNYQRLFRTEFEPVECDAVRVTITAANGITEARIFEVRVYE